MTLETSDKIARFLWLRSFDTILLSFFTIILEQNVNKICIYEEKVVILHIKFMSTRKNMKYKTINHIV